MKKTLFVIALGCASAIFTTSCNDNNAAENRADDKKDSAEARNEQKFETKASEKDAQFVVDVVAANYGEVKLAQLAEQKSSSKEVKELAGMLDSEHTALLGELKTLAASKSISIPNEETSDAKEDVKDLEDDKPAEFNKNWTKELKEKHKNTVDKFEKYSTEATDADLKSWITATLPKLRAHYDKLAQLEEKMK